MHPSFIHALLSAGSTVQRVEESLLLPRGPFPLLLSSLPLWTRTVSHLQWFTACVYPSPTQHKDMFYQESGSTGVCFSRSHSEVGNEIIKWQLKTKKTEPRSPDGEKYRFYGISMTRYWEKYRRGQSEANYFVCISKVLIYKAHKVGKKNTFLLLVMMEVGPEAGLTLQTGIKYRQKITNIYDNVFPKHIEPITVILDNLVLLNLQVMMLQRKRCSISM